MKDFMKKSGAKISRYQKKFDWRKELVRLAE
jgi:hypothetical protein